VSVVTPAAARRAVNRRIDREFYSGMAIAVAAALSKADTTDTRKTL